MRELEGSGYSRSEAQARALLEYWLYQPGQAGLQGALSGGVGALTSLTLGRLFGENRAPAGEEGWTEAIEAGWADEDGPGLKHKRDIDSDWEDGIIASTGDVFKRTPELERHIQYVDPSTPRKRGIGRAHSSEEFFKNDVQIVKAIPSQDIPGVTYYQYNLPLLGKDGQPTGGYGTRIFEKTIYDASIFPFEEYMRRGLEAANESYRRNHVLGDQWDGVDSLGVIWIGYGRGGKPTSFFPDILGQ